MALMREQHAATKAVYREWLFEKTGKEGGRSYRLESDLMGGPNLADAAWRCELSLA
jgi:hypothetical protein